MLGNLVLTRDNSAYSNKAFPDKRGAAGAGEPERACYAQSPLRQEQELARLDDWTPDEIVSRQQQLAAWALQRWTVDPPSQPAAVVDELDDDSNDDVTVLLENG